MKPHAVALMPPRACPFLRGHASSGLSQFTALLPSPSPQPDAMYTMRSRACASVSAHGTHLSHHSSMIPFLSPSHRSYYLALAVMVGIILAAYPWAVIGLSNQLGRTRKENIKLRAIFKKNHNINVLSAARFFLFASRDLWFEVTLPYFLRNAASGIGWGRTLVGTYLAVSDCFRSEIRSTCLPHLL